MQNPDTFPAPLQAIVNTLNQLRPESNLSELKLTWKKYLLLAQEQIPGIHIERDGEIVCLGALSPGCKACKSGTWDCIFTSTQCNLHCEFCYNPCNLPVNYAGSVFGKTPGVIAANHARTDITGISFSGGEPFLFPKKLVEWLAYFKARMPGKYYWVYTNGLLVDETSLHQLGDLGLDEIRFNAAATNYTHPHVLNNISLAAHYIPNITVEIPAIPEHSSRLLAALSEWSALGVKYINLHELMYEPGTISAEMPGKRREVILPDGHRTQINPESRLLTLAVMKKVQAENLSLAVNDCSLQSKLRQLRGRRRSLAP